ncbi:transglycosylase domain-containing protein [Ferdinandcohnia quinoae]|uniref:PBP1A family penicillin-binding protein n=1 Tax=Fredinandcohnia quinoae TaxID=2918902 RepID=A0AAW5DVN5_9BACI|nr:PBP1A family penicillin-binding protein [Fredinandcohnia sp. SECRCQ15]MCH1624707.1 PBP1A family penicillin-binding protein [Fredinandcohnia sp. SECRCQ15]
MTEKYQSREERRKSQGNNNKKKQPKKQKRSLFKRILIIMFSLGILFMVAGAITFFVLASGAPPLDEALLKDPLSSKVYDINGKKIYEFGAEKRTFVPIDEIPDDLKNAVIAVEDARFYKHHGLDVIRLGGAVIANITEGYGAEGASTISQQVIKNSFFTQDKKLKRKVQELWMAFQLERKYSKEQILEMYLNKIYYGVGNTYGVAKAAELYYGKTLDELTLEESAFIAGVGNNPGLFNPYTHPERAEKRRNIVLNLMEKNNFITKEEATAAKTTAIDATLVASKEESQPIDSFLDQVKKELKEQGGIDVYTAGLKIYTSFDPDAQAHIDSLLNNEGDVQFPNDEFQAGIALIDTQTGEIRALGGGRNQSANSRINFAIDPLNQPGSTIKPIIDYGPAIENLKWSTYHQIVDEPTTYTGSDKKINNVDFKYLGQMTIRTALAKSRNTTAVKTFREVGGKKAREFAVNLGMPFSENEVNEAYAIGGTEGGISPLQMAGAYAAFGNNGNFNKPHAVKKIIYPDDTEVVMAPESVPVMKEATAFMITDMLKSVLEPGGSAAGYDVSGLPIAGKTGTTNYDSKTAQKYNIESGVPDVWFSGYTTNYTISIWTGYKDNITPIKNKERNIAKQLFRDIITYVSKDKDTKDFVKPNSVVKVGVEKGTNPAKLPSEFTPKEDIVYEYFIKGTEPTEISDKYDKLTSPTDLVATYNAEKNEIALSWNFPKDKLDGISFEVSASIDEGPGIVQGTLKDLTYTMVNPIPGAIYSFTIVAVSDDNKENRSDPISSKIEIPIIPDITNPGDDNGNGNDNGEGNGNGDGNDDGNGDDDTGIDIPDIPPLPPGDVNDQSNGRKGN